MKLKRKTYAYTGAEFSPCGRYRYRLWRTWRPGDDIACFIMLNPSTADETTNDPTVARCERRARDAGYGGLRVLNIFALRSTDPAELYRAEDPVGPENDKNIAAFSAEADLIVCAWGEHGRHLGRGSKVVQLLRKLGDPLHVLGLNRSGQPKHPLYISYQETPKPWALAG